MEKNKQESEVWTQLFSIIDRVPLLTFGYVAAACTDFGNSDVQVELCESPTIRLVVRRKGQADEVFEIQTENDRSAESTNRRALHAYERIATYAGCRKSVGQFAA